MNHEKCVQKRSLSSLTFEQKPKIVVRKGRKHGTNTIINVECKRVQVEVSVLRYEDSAFYDCGTSRKRLKHDCTRVLYDNKCNCHEVLRLQCDYACTCTTTTAQLMTTGTRQQSQSDTISYRLWHE